MENIFIHKAVPDNCWLIILNLCIFSCTHTHIHTCPQKHTVYTCLDKKHFPCSQADMASTDWQMARVLALGFSPQSWMVMIEKTLTHHATPESVVVFFLIHYTRIPTMGLTCSAHSHSIVKNQSWVLNMEQVGPKREHKSCKCTWTLLQALLSIKKQSVLVRICVFGNSVVHKWTGRRGLYSRESFWDDFNCKHEIF